MEKKFSRFDDLMECLLSGNLSDDMQKELVEILDSDLEFQYRYSALSKMHAVSMLPYLNSKKEGNYDRLTDLLEIDRTKPRRWILGSKWRGVAAALLLMGTTAATTYLIHNQAIIEHNSQLTLEAESPQGSKTKLNLSDGTVVWLNSESKLTLNNSFGTKNRNVYLDGEAYFEVSKQDKSPFKVHIDNIEVKVLGTKFNIQGYGHNKDIVTTLLEGNLLVENRTTGEIVQMLPDQKVTFNRLSGAMTKSQSSNSLLSILWKNGVWDMHSIPLHELCKELETIYGVKILINNPKYLNTRFTGRLYANESIDEFMKLIRKTINIRYNRQDDLIIIQ